MEKRTAKVNISAAGGTAAKGSRTCKVTLPTTWLEAMGVSESQRELERKLSAKSPRKGAPQEGEEQRQQRREMAQEVAQRMAQVGLVDDREYASTVVRHYSRKGYGPAKIRDELYRRGVPREFWDEAMEERDQGDDKLRALVEKKLRGAAPTREELKKVSAYLARRGFGWEEISRVLSQVEQEAE